MEILREKNKQINWSLQVCTKNISVTWKCWILRIGKGNNGGTLFIGVQSFASSIGKVQPILVPATLPILKPLLVTVEVKSNKLVRRIVRWPTILTLPNSRPTIVSLLLKQYQFSHCWTQQKMWWNVVEPLKHLKNHRSHVWYIYLHLVDFFGKFLNVGKYTSPIDPMGNKGKWLRLRAFGGNAFLSKTAKTLASPWYQLENLFCLATLKNKKKTHIYPTQQKKHSKLFMFVSTISISLKKNSLTPM